MTRLNVQSRQGFHVFSSPTPRGREPSGKLKSCCRVGSQAPAAPPRLRPPPAARPQPNVALLAAAHLLMGTSRGFYSTIRIPHPHESRTKAPQGIRHQVVNLGTGYEYRYGQILVPAGSSSLLTR